MKTVLMFEKVQQYLQYNLFCRAMMFLPGDTYVKGKAEHQLEQEVRIGILWLEANCAVFSSINHAQLFYSGVGQMNIIWDIDQTPSRSPEILYFSLFTR